MLRLSRTAAASARMLFLTLLLLAPGRAADAQETLWVQIEARPTLDSALERAAAWASAFAETRGFRLRSGWYGVVLGPYGGNQAVAALDRLKRENLIPLDSYITDGSEFRESFWPPLPAPAEAAPPADEAPALPEPQDDMAAAPGEALPDEALPDETAAEARASESALDAEGRKALQTALQWFGFYDGAIDGAFGPATRASMAAWQGAQGLEQTGVLTTRQREALTAAHGDEVAAFGFETVTDAEAGLSVTLPLALVEFDRYDPPFVHFRARDGSGLSILLISEPGGADALAGLYDLLQSLDDMPREGARNLAGDRFRIEGLSPERASHAFARLEGATIKGWLVLSRPGTAARDARILEALERSFRSTGGAALDPGMVMLDDATRRGLVAGLELRRPRFSRSGVFVSDEGAVLTTLAATEGCGRITIDHTIEARVRASDPAAGLSLLAPERPLAPASVASLREDAPPLGGEITVAGYPYEGRLPAPVLTWGTVEALSGLDGEAGRLRLAIDARAGDAGGPVLDPAGALVGLLLPPGNGNGGRELPGGVAFAADAAVLAEMLAGAGIHPRPAASHDVLPPETLTRRARAMTVLVSCWDEAGP